MDEYKARMTGRVAEAISATNNDHELNPSPNNNVNF